MGASGIDVAGGVIDADFRGEVKMILVNNGNEVLQDSDGEGDPYILLIVYYQG